MNKPKNKKKDEATGGTIALNKRARHEYHIDERFEAGIALEGWEVKSLREGKGQITEAYAIVKDGEIFLFGSQIMPLLTASTHVVPEARRTRKLLLHRNEIERLIGKVREKGFTMVPLSMYEKDGRVKVELALVTGKEQHDRREDTKKREAQREIDRAMASRRR
jgi:SsrA-binding protein